MAKLEDDLKIKVKVASPEIRAVATVMNSMVFKKIIHNNTLTGDGEKEPLGIAPEILSDISTAKSDITSLKTADLNLETKILNLSTKQSQTDTKITYINLDITNLQSDVAGLQSNVSNALSSIQTDIAGLQADISTVQTDVSNLQTNISTINSYIGQVDAKFADYLPLSGGSMTGPLKFADNVGFVSYDRLGRPIVGVGYVDNPYWAFDPQDDSFYPLLSGYMDLGQVNSKWRTIYAQRLATTEGIGYLEIPTESGTLARVEDIPTLLSQLTNDLGFATSAEVQALIAALPKYRVEKVSVLPETGEELVLYLVPKDGSTNDVYDEYIWEDGSYELLGTTQVDLSGYLPTTGGTLTGEITFNMPATSAYADIPIIKAHNAYGGIDTVLSLGTNGDGLPSSSLLKAKTLSLSERLNTKYIGRASNKVLQLYAEKIGNLTVPEETGTIARIEDLSNYVSVEEFSNTISGIATDFVQWVAFDGGTVGQVLTKTADGFSWSDTLSRGLTILTTNTFGSPMFSLSAGGQYEWTFYIRQTGLELHYGGYSHNVLKFPTTGGTLATTQNIADIGGAGTTGQVLTKTADGFSWQDSQGGGGGESLPTGGSNGDVLTLNNDTPTWSAPVARHNYIGGYINLPDNGRWFYYPSIETTENIVEFAIAQNGEFQGIIALQIFSGSNMTPRAKWLTNTHNLVDPDVYFDPNYNLGSLMIKINPGVSGGGISVYASATRLGNPSNSTGIGISPDYTLPSNAIAAVWDSGLPTTTSSNVDGQVLALEKWNGEYRPQWTYPVARALPSSQIYSQREFWYRLDNIYSTTNCVHIFVENAEDGGENERYYVHFVVDNNTTPKIIAESHTPRLFDIEIFTDLGNAGYGQLFGVVHITPKETANIARFVVGATRIGDPINSYQQQVLYTYTPGDQGTIMAQYMYASERYVDNSIADLATQTQLHIDTVVGDINSVLDTINGEVV